MQTVKDLTVDQIFKYGWIDELNRDMEIANQGGYEATRPIIDFALDNDETVEELKASLILVRKSLTSYMEAVSRVAYKYDEFKSNIINSSNTADEKIHFNDLELLKRLENR